MKLKQIVERLEDLLGTEPGKRRRKADELKALLKRLKKKQRKLEHALQQAVEPEEAKALRRKLKVVLVHRKKGVQVLRKLHKENSE